MKIIKIISAEDTYCVRQPVLRDQKPIESCRFEGDELPTTVHLGAFDDNILIGVASLYEATNVTFNARPQLQLRGMAVAKAQQHQRIGEQLLKRCESMALQKKVALLWFNARESAVGFYQKMGYQTQGERFEIETVGPHFIMFKTLN